MVMEINVTVAAVVILAALVLVGWLVRENLKDEKDFEKTLNESEIKPDLHEEDRL